MLKSSREQSVLSSGHCSRCSIVCVSVPQLHERSPVWYPHLIKFALIRPTPDLSRLSVFYVGQGAQQKRDSVKNKPVSLLVVSLGKTLNWMPPSLCGRQMVGPSSLPVVIAPV